MVIIAVVAVVLLVAAGFFLKRMIEAPLYTPGMVRAGKNMQAPLDPPEQTAEGYWHVEKDVRLFYDTQGSGRPVLVVHGGPGYPIHRPLPALEPLSDQFKFYYYDQRGCGKSTKPFDRFDSSNFYANMKELEQMLGMQAGYDSFLKDYLAFGSIFSKSEDELARMNRRIGEYFLAATGRAGEVSELAPPADNGGWMVQAMYFSMGKRHDYRQALRQVRAPALVIHGENDLIPERVSRMYAECLPAGELNVIKSGRTRGGHAPFSDDHEKVADIVRSFFSRLHR